MKINFPEEKDKILEYCLKYPKTYWGINAIKENVLKELSTFEINKIFIEITQFDKAIVDFSKSIGICSSALTEKFIKDGGFTKIAETEKKKREKEIRKYNFDLKVSKFKYYTFWPLFSFAVLTFVVSIYNFINNHKPLLNSKYKEQQISKKELELKKRATPVLAQKNLDALHNSPASVKLTSNSN